MQPVLFETTLSAFTVRPNILLAMLRHIVIDSGSLPEQLAHSIFEFARVSCQVLFDF